MKNRKRISSAGKRPRRGFTICDEMAGNPIYFPLLFGLGLREFSVAPMALLEVKEAGRGGIREKAEGLAHKALERDSSEEIMKILEAFRLLNQTKH
jgi:phosphoenolpyruvate-protein phosphotransferase (PTS system enzyme I)